MLCLVCIATFHIAPTLLQMKTFGALAERSDTIAYEVENRLTNMLRSMKIGDIGKDEGAFSQVRMFCEAILNLPKVDVEHLRDIMESCEMVRDLLQSSDMTRLETAVNTLQSSAQECQDDPNSVQTKFLSAFFLKHKVGAGLLAWARQLLDCNENAVEFDKGLESMRENSQALAHKGVSPETLNNELNRFWKACTPLQSMDALPHQKLQLEASVEELWVSVTGMVTHVLKNAFTGTLEIVFEAMDNGGKVKADDQTEEELRMQGILDLLEYKDVARHVCWKELQLPAKLSESLAVYQGLARDVGDLLQFVLSTIPGCRSVFTGKLPESPTVEVMHKWLSSLPRLLEEWMDDEHIRSKCEEKCFKLVKDRLESLSLSSYQTVGDLVTKIVQGDGHLEANAAALAEAKLKLPVGSKEAQLVDFFLQAGL